MAFREKGWIKWWKLFLFLNARRSNPSSSAIQLHKLISIRFSGENDFFCFVADQWERKTKYESHFKIKRMNYDVSGKEKFIQTDILLISFFLLLLLLFTFPLITWDTVVYHVNWFSSSPNGRWENHTFLVVFW